MRITKRLEKMIEEHDIDEGEIILAVMLDPDSKEEEMETAIYDFLIALPDYDPAYEYKTHLFIQANLIDDDDEDDSENEDDEDDEVTSDDEVDFLMSQRELEEDWNNDNE